MERAQVPGQFVGVRLISSDLEAGSDTSEERPADRLLAITSSPYAARRDSSNLDATIIEVCVPTCPRMPTMQRPVQMSGEGDSELRPQSVRGRRSKLVLYL